MEQEAYFVQVPEPTEIRKNLLSNSRNIIQVLQRIERLKQLRIKKIEKIADIRKTNKEIRLLINKLKKELPAAGMRITAKDAGAKKKRGVSELKELEEELRMIEGKIARLS